ncbi:MAG: Lrp/AsnC family transcriptional regulator, partial [Deltaproteobacteria bacterium]|nr:Lrp/AsnC family transcriptional regulator [Deltaproteobacteria bacterium]
MPENNELNQEMDQVDRDILNLIQSGFPITARPYQVLGEELG